MMLKIGEKLKGKVIESPYHDIREFYDLTHHRPFPRYEMVYLKVKKEISALGLNFT